ncbi:MAG: potassium transporter Kup [Thermoanaerobaculia bacterium]
MTPRPGEPSKRRLGFLALAALGVVYGDIGTSPLYAIRECLYGPHAAAPTRANVLGALSLVFWTLVVVVTLKYQVYVLRADNRGEGGVLALMALVRSRVKGRARWLVLALGLFGAALLYADGVLTPAISVLGALEGLTVLRPELEHLVVPVAVAILVGLFALQRRGTGGVGAIFGPVTLVWFGTIAALGLRGILREPSVLAAVDPRYGARLLAAGDGPGFLILGAIFLVATGGEALYADLGHFGRRPIQIDWFAVVGGSLLLSYFGQGALILADPEAARNPFFLLAPDWMRLPLLVLATAAAIIASQAIISGSFSLTRQAVQLGYLPRLEIVHTSASEIGQIYVPVVNRLLAAATIAVVVTFRTSTEVAGAYGVALTTTMFITTLLAAVAARRIWRWSLPFVLALTAALLVPDLAFFAAALTKIPDGGWFPLVVALGVLAVMTSWYRGRRVLRAKLLDRQVPLARLLDDIERRGVPRVPGTAVYLSNDPTGTPIALLHNLKINRIVHERNFFLTIRTCELPWVDGDDRLEIREVRPGYYRAIARYGFLEDPDIAELFTGPRLAALGVDVEDTSFVLNRSELVPAGRSVLPGWRRRLFVLLSRNAETADRYFRIPPNRVLDIGMVIGI